MTIQQTSMSKHNQYQWQNTINSNVKTPSTAMPKHHQSQCQNTNNSNAKTPLIPISKHHQPQCQNTIKSNTKTPPIPIKIKWTFSSIKFLHERNVSRLSKYIPISYISSFARATACDKMLQQQNFGRNRRPKNAHFSTNVSGLKAIQPSDDDW